MTDAQFSLLQMPAWTSARELKENFGFAVHYHRKFRNWPDAEEWGRFGEWKEENRAWLDSVWAAERPQDAP